MARPALTIPAKPCDRCGAMFQRKRFTMALEDPARFRARRFCSLHCANSRGVRSQCSASQHRISQAFVKPQCELCGVTQRLHVHHKNEDWKDHRLENLQTLCIRCHLGGHNRKDRKCNLCSGKHKGHGLCLKHFQRWKKYGDPLLTKRQGPNGFRLVRDSSSPLKDFPSLQASKAAPPSSGASATPSSPKSPRRSSAPA